MKAKERILDRLRKAQPQEIDAPAAAASYGELFRLPAWDNEDGLSNFREKFLTLRGELYEVRGAAEAADKVLALVRELPGRIQWQQHPLLGLLRRESAALRERLGEESALDTQSSEFAESVCGITVADSLLAHSGSILLRSSSAGGRRLSALPPQHIVVAARSQLHKSMAPWLDELERDGSWSLASVISGPSRTADIEKILVFGAHGPKRLALVLMTDV